MAWFPIFENLMKWEQFLSLPPRHKLYYFYLASEFNRRGVFYQSDLEVAVILAMSVKTIQRARDELMKMGLIEFNPGQLKRDRRFATKYLSVQFATTGEGKFFAQIGRYTFETMLDLLRKAQLQPGDVVTYLSLYYWQWRNRGKHEERDRFFITKKELINLTNLIDAPKSVGRLYNNFIFANDNHLFEYEEKHQKFIFKKWLTCAEPDEDENNQRIAERRLEEIKKLITIKKRKRELNLRKAVNLQGHNRKKTVSA